MQKVPDTTSGVLARQAVGERGEEGGGRKRDWERPLSKFLQVNIDQGGQSVALQILMAYNGY